MQISELYTTVESPHAEALRRALRFLTHHDGEPRFGAVAHAMCMRRRHPHDHGERLQELVSQLGLGTLHAG